jgi:two-component system, cell cycle sensor histidine kinase and response regulator CckA
MMHMTEPAGQEIGAAVPMPEHAIIEVTQTGIVTSWNPGAVLLYGYLEEEVVGRSADVLRPPGRRAEQADVLRRVIRAGQSERYETDMVRKDGTVVTVSLTVAPIISPAGAAVGVRSVSWEVSGQQAAQDHAVRTIGGERRDARHVQERTDTQRRDARDAQERIDVKADTQRRDARDAQERIDVKAGTQRRDARDAQEQTEAAQDSERRDAQDLFDARRDDERRTTFEQNQGLHAQVRQIQQMESLGQLAGGVAHDFNNLLTIILSYATFVSRRLDVAAESSVDGSWDEARADMAQIQHAVGRSAALTRQLLAFASREAVRPVALDLNEVIANVEELLCRAIGEHIELATSLADGLWPVLADAGKLEQVLVNLAVNARDAMPDGGTLTISTENITTTANSAGADPKGYQERHVQLRVSDTGTGMTSDVIEHVFEPFFTTKAASRGTGLGLATVYGILTQADASIQISSQPGMGTTFTIVLPVTDEVGAPAGEPAHLDWEPHGETILLVEDEDELREATKRIFADAGYHVIAAASGPEALQIARDHDGPIHLLVTDIVMPHMLGTEAAERMRAIKPGAAVLYMSGYAWPVHASQGRLDPDVVLVEKPFADADLLVKAGQALSGHHPGLRTGQGTGA